MSEQELDLSAARPTRFSATSEELADRLLAGEGHVLPLESTGSYLVRSLHRTRVYTVTAVQDAHGNPLGHLCDCPNGTRGGVQARCYHSLAVEKITESQKEQK